jgi:hypothetical protein
MKNKIMLAFATLSIIFIGGAVSLTSVQATSSGQNGVDGFWHGFWKQIDTALMDFPSLRDQMHKSFGTDNTFFYKFWQTDNVYFMKHKEKDKDNGNHYGQMDNINWRKDRQQWSMEHKN